MTNNAGHVMNLANSIIGVGLLAMPFCFKQCGITLAITMLVLSSVISKLACHFLVKSSAMCRRRNFEFLAFYTFGPSGKLLVELGVIGFMMGTCVAFFVVMGDLGPAIISRILNINNNSTLRTTILIAIGVFVILPLGLLKNVESLVAISTATIGFYFLFIIKIFFESSPRLIAGDWWYHVNFWKPEGVLQCIPIFAMSLSCQTQLFEIYESLSSPTVEKINSVVHSAINLCTAVYTIVGFLGYAAYCKGTFTGNILLSFSPSFSSEMFKLGFVMSIAVSFPLVIFPCRASLYSLIYKRVPIHHEAGQTSLHIPDSRFKLLTIGIVSVSLITGLLIPSIELVLGFVGSTIGIAICVIFPSLSFLNLNNKDTNDKTIAKITVIIGVLIMVLGTFGNLFAAVENESVESPSMKFVNVYNSEGLKARPKKQVVIDTSKKDNVAAPFKDSISHEENINKMKPPEAAVVENKLQENQRKEPPVPVAPAIESKINRKFAVPENRQQNEIDQKKLMPKSKKIGSVADSKLNRSISKDAIEKENREIMEIEKQKKAEEDRKEREVMKALEDQEKLLLEMKSREMKNQEKNDKTEVPKNKLQIAEPEVKNVKRETLKSESFPVRDVRGNNDAKSNFNLSLKNEKKGDEMESGKFHPDLKNSSFWKDQDGIRKNFSESSKLLSGNVKREINDFGKSNFVETGLPNSSLKIPSPDVTNETKNSKTIRREKRETKEMEGNSAEEKKFDFEKCLIEKQNVSMEIKGEDKVTSDPGDDSKPINAENLPATVDRKMSGLIKNSVHLSVDVAEKKKAEASNAESSELIDSVLSRQSMMGKKRDLKSVAPIVN